MAWTLLMTLAWATSASAVRYSDYSGVKMPYYGSNEDVEARDVGQLAVSAEDYRGHSHDASASLDYKYDDDRHDKSEKPAMESDDVVKWNKRDRKHRELFRPPEENDLDIIDRYVPKTDTATRLKANRRFSKHRSRLKKKRNFYKDGQVSSQWSAKNTDAKMYKSGNMKDDFNIDEYQTRDVEQEGSDTDHEFYRPREVTERVVRRRPRDKHFNRIRPNIETSNNNIGPDNKIKRERHLNSDNMPDDENHDRQRRPYRPFQGEEEDQEQGDSDKQKGKTYEDYGEYYDMKRVHNIKSKIPKLLRRPTARVDTTLAASSYEIDALWTYRRLNPSTLESSPSITSTRSTTETSTPTTPAPQPTKELSKASSEELSLAEKSKLSILKKAQRKENMHKDMLSNKPPVLLQVTDKMLTVVVVEPPTSEVPWMRASILVHDTPERLERAKILMRNKLVARARNIQELTDNWDEVICDYIDTSLLDSVPQINTYYALYIAEIFLLFVVR